MTAIGGAGPVTVTAGSLVSLSVPNEEPEEVLAAVATFCERNPAVLAAYWGELDLHTRSEPPHLAIGLEISDERQVESLCLEAVDIARRAGVTMVDVAPIGAAGDHELTALLMEEGRMFFRR